MKSILADAPPPAHSRPETQNPTGVLSLALASSPGAGPDPEGRALTSHSRDPRSTLPPAFLVNPAGQTFLARRNHLPPPSRPIPAHDVLSRFHSSTPRRTPNAPAPEAIAPDPPPTSRDPPSETASREPLSARSRNALALASALSLRGCLAVSPLRLRSLFDDRSTSSTQLTLSSHDGWRPLGLESSLEPALGSRSPSPATGARRSIGGLDPAPSHALASALTSSMAPLKQQYPPPHSPPIPGLPCLPSRLAGDLDNTFLGVK